MIETQAEGRLCGEVINSSLFPGKLFHLASSDLRGVINVSTGCNTQDPDLICWHEPGLQPNGNIAKVVPDWSRKPITELSRMSEDDYPEEEWHTGLRALDSSSFPKKCANCGRVFETALQYFQETMDVNNDTGLRRFVADDTTVIVESFRNCPCGSTLMDNFTDRRNESAAGNARRKRFDRLKQSLIASGLDADTAHKQVLELIREEQRETVKKLKLDDYT